jgi:hypothetical protein
MPANIVITAVGLSIAGIAASAAAAPVPIRVGGPRPPGISHRSPDLLRDIPAMQREIDGDAKLGVRPKAITVGAKYVDLSPVRAAAKRLGAHGSQSR